MRLSFVEVAGFRGFGERTRLDLSAGFTVLSGRNGSGKSTLLDAIEFTLTGTMSKFDVTSAKGGGLDEHIWWLGHGKADNHYVSVGFVGDDGKPFQITRSRADGSDTSAEEVVRRLCNRRAVDNSSLETLIKTTLIRDESIAALSLDLPERARFAAVRAAIGGLMGPDYSKRTAEILAAAEGAKTRQEQRIRAGQEELGRLLGELTEVRSLAERSADLADALRVVESFMPGLSSAPSAVDRSSSLRRYVAEKRIALREIEATRARTESLLPEVNYFNSPAVQVDILNAQEGYARAAKSKASAEERLDVARRGEQVERDHDQFAAHMAALVEHGSAVGLQKGHCPLCAATRTAQAFEEALTAARTSLAARGSKLAAARQAVQEAQSAVDAAEKEVVALRELSAAISARKQALDRNIAGARAVYDRHNFKAPLDDPESAQTLLFAEQENLVSLERAMAILDSSNAIERMTALESRIAVTRASNEEAAAKLAIVGRAVESARQIDAAAKTVSNEILTEQFGTVMPLLKELYRRLRPHGDWSEIDSDFGGKVRGSLNFVVGDGYNPQFLFSSGQRRAAGLSFLLAVHLSRPWCAWQSLLLDDPVQHIDDYRALNLVEVLTAIRRSGRQVIVAVEDASLASVLCRRLIAGSGEVGRYIELRGSSTGTVEIARQQEVYPMPHLVLRPSQAS
jgi:chromosome segregation protein